MDDRPGGPYLPDDERVLAEIVEQAARPLDHLLSADDRRTIREVLADALATHPDTAALLEQLRQRALPETSGPVEKGDPAPTGGAERGSKASGGER